VGNAHLFWDPAFAGVKLAQAQAVTKEVQRLEEKYGPMYTLLCGDFNSLPGTRELCSNLALCLHTAILCRTQQYAATRYNMLQRTAILCNTLLCGDINLLLCRRELCRSAPYFRIATHYNTLQHITTHCNTLQHPAIPCNPLLCCDFNSLLGTRELCKLAPYLHTATHYNTLQHAASRCNMPQHAIWRLEFAAQVRCYYVCMCTT